MKVDKYVLLPQPIEKDAIKLLEKNSISFVIADKPTFEVVKPLMKRCKAIILRTGIKITDELLEDADELLTISRTGGGVDNVDLDAATKKGIIVTSSIGVNTISVIEHALTLMLVLFKQIIILDRAVRENNFRIRYKNLPKDIYKKILGVVGFGRIGSGFARICKESFDMKILAFDEYLGEVKKKEYSSWVEFVDLEYLFKISDIVSIHIPLNEETRGIINNKYLSLMKNSAFLINTSRGGVINEKDLINVLIERKIAGAGLDVFEKEPPDENNPLLKMDNVVLTPHSAALTEECVKRMAVSAVERVLDVFNGFIPDNIANPEVLKNPRWSTMKRKH